MAIFLFDHIFVPKLSVKVAQIAMPSLTDHVQKKLETVMTGTNLKMTKNNQVKHTQNEVCLMFLRPTDHFSIESKLCA